MRLTASEPADRQGAGCKRVQDHDGASSASTPDSRNGNVLWSLASAFPFPLFSNESWQQDGKTSLSRAYEEREREPQFVGVLLRMGSGSAG